MKEKAFFAIVTLMTLIICICYLQFCRNMDAINSFSSNNANCKTQHINVVLNQIIVTENETAIAESIIQHVLNNDFHTIKFSFNDGYPNELIVSVYKSKEDISSNNVLFSFSYKQIEGETEKYDISQAKHMTLEIYK